MKTNTINTFSICCICFFTLISQSHIKINNQTQPIVVPQFKVTLCNINHYASVAELLQLDSLCIVSRDTLPAKITSFNITIAPKLGAIVILQCTGNSFNKKVKDLFRKLKSGDNLVIEGIRLQAEDGIRPMHPISVFIK